MLLKNLKLSSIKLFLIIDSIIIFINISNSYSIIPYLLFFQYSRAVNTILITIINVIYILLRFKTKIYMPLHILFGLYIVINLTNILSGLISNTFQPTWLAYLFANVSFYFILFNLFKEYSNFDFAKRISLILRGYLWLVIINLLSVLILFVLIYFLDFDPLVNNVNNKMDLFLDNVIRGRGLTTYYFPMNISIIYSGAFIRIPFLQSHGIICGLYHEPHIITFMITPALFVLLSTIKNWFSRILIFSAFIMVFLLAASTTNIFALIVCLIVVIFNKFRTNIILPASLILLSITIFSLIDENLYSFIFSQLQSGSRDYSVSTISFAFNPVTLLGTNFFNQSYLFDSTRNYDVGYINFTINIIFLLVLIFHNIKLLISKNSTYQVIGLFCLYFLLHSMKVAMVTYSLSFLMMVIFLLSIYSKELDNLNLKTSS
jgi:hypothetical protein